MIGGPIKMLRCCLSFTQLVLIQIIIICGNNMNITLRDIEKAKDVDLASEEQPFRMHFRRRPLEIQGWRRGRREQLG